jgi:hypothetical protein
VKRKMLFVSIALTVLALVFVVASSNTTPASAAPRAAIYTIDWYTIDGGGVMNLQGGTYTLSGTIGQSDAGTLSGGNYKLNSGFWGFVDSLTNLFLPLIMR